jgi:hypothetical protein
VRKKLEGDVTLRDRSPHSVDTLLEFVSLCLKNTYFQFEDKFYQQNHGTAMGSPLSPVACDIFFESLECQAIEAFHIKPKLYKRYVDDTFISWPENEAPVERDHRKRKRWCTTIPRC